MAIFSSHAAGTPCWVDLASPDVDASKAFYHAVFGWDAVDQFDGDQRVYTQFMRDGRKVAGLGGQQPGTEGMPGVWATYVAVDDCGAIAEAVGAAGGTVVLPPMPVMEAGSMAVFQDPAGAFFSVWQPGEHKGAEVCNEADTWSWNELMTRDLAGATDFYSKVFGWTYAEHDMGPLGTYHVIEGGENDGLGGLMAMPDDVPPMVPDHWLVYFTVADLDASIAKVTANGGIVVQPPMSIPGIGTMATLHDPQGGSFAMLQPPAT